MSNESNSAIPTIMFFCALLGIGTVLTAYSNKDVQDNKEKEVKIEKSIGLKSVNDFIKLYKEKNGEYPNQQILQNYLNENTGSILPYIQNNINGAANANDLYIEKTDTLLLVKSKSKSMGDIKIKLYSDDCDKEFSKSNIKCISF